MNINFMGLPKHLQNLSVFSTNSRGIRDIIVDAGKQAGVNIRTSEKLVEERNPNLFNQDGQLTRSRSTYNMLHNLEEYYFKKGEIKTCVDLRDALAQMYKEAKKDDAPVYLLDIIADD